MRAALVDTSPLFLGIVPFGVIAGVAAVANELDGLHAVGLSVLVFAGAAQLAAIDLLGAGAGIAVVVGTVLVINARMAMYSAALAPHYRGERLGVRAAQAYVLTDQAFALSVTRINRGHTDHQVAYYFTAAFSLWVVWQLSTIGGVAAGAGIPDSWSLDFAVPLVFLALLVPAVSDRATAAAAVVGGLVAVAAGGLPHNLGLLTGAGAGILAGWSLGRE